jgi:hypothetical protein
MTRRKRQGPRPFEIVMDEAGEDAFPWNLDEHLNGCVAAYQNQPSYAAAVYFALEAIWGIARDVDVRAKMGTLSKEELNEDWLLPPLQTVPIPWMWIRVLATAWRKYRNEGGSLGEAFGLEGGGQGKPPAMTKLLQMLDERAIARWIWARVQKARAAGDDMDIEDIILEAEEKFDRSDGTIRRAWRRFGGRERQRSPAES